MSSDVNLPTDSASVVPLVPKRRFNWRKAYQGIVIANENPGESYVYLSDLPADLKKKLTQKSAVRLAGDITPLFDVYANVYQFTQKDLPGASKKDPHVGALEDILNGNFGGLSSYDKRLDTAIEALNGINERISNSPHDRELSDRLAETVLQYLGRNRLISKKSSELRYDPSSREYVKNEHYNAEFAKKVNALEMAAAKLASKSSTHYSILREVLKGSYDKSISKNTKKLSKRWSIRSRDAARDRFNRLLGYALENSALTKRELTQIAQEYSDFLKENYIQVRSHESAKETSHRVRDLINYENQRFKDIGGLFSEEYQEGLLKRYRRLVNNRRKKSEDEYLARLFVGYKKELRVKEEKTALRREGDASYQGTQIDELKEIISHQKTKYSEDDVKGIADGFLNGARIPLGLAKSSRAKRIERLYQTYEDEYTSGLLVSYRDIGVNGRKYTELDVDAYISQLLANGDITPLRAERIKKMYSKYPIQSSPNGFIHTPIDSLGRVDLTVLGLKEAPKPDGNSLIILENGCTRLRAEYERLTGQQLPPSPLADSTPVNKAEYYNALEDEFDRLDQMVELAKHPPVTSSGGNGSKRGLRIKSHQQLHDPGSDPPEPAPLPPPEPAPLPPPAPVTLQYLSHANIKSIESLATTGEDAAFVNLANHALTNYHAFIFQNSSLTTEHNLLGSFIFGYNSHGNQFRLRSDGLLVEVKAVEKIEREGHDRLQTIVGTVQPENGTANWQHSNLIVVEGNRWTHTGKLGPISRFADRVTRKGWGYDHVITMLFWPGEYNRNPFYSAVNPDPNQSSPGNIYIGLDFLVNQEGYQSVMDALITNPRLANDFLHQMQAGFGYSGKVIQFNVGKHFFMPPKRDGLLDAITPQDGQLNYLPAFEVRVTDNVKGSNNPKGTRTKAWSAPPDLPVMLQYAVSQAQ